MLSALAVLAALVSACALRPEMCDGTTACGAKSACVANRCQASGAVPAIRKSRRFVLTPIDLAFIEQGSDRPPGVLPDPFTVGRHGVRNAALLARWVAPMLDDAEVIEAYVLLDRVDDAVPESGRIGLHAEQVVGDWSGRTATWVTGPALSDVNAPTLFLREGAPRRVRIDVAPIVAHWREAGVGDRSIAIVADHWNATGASFAAIPAASVTLPGEPELHPLDAALGPRLELYVK
jgi:hypothetical protein